MRSLSDKLANDAHCANVFDECIRQMENDDSPVSEHIELIRVHWGDVEDPLIGMLFILASYTSSNMAPSQLGGVP